QGVVVYEPVICSCVRCSVLCALIGQIKVLIVRCASTVMVSDRRHTCKGGERIVQVACVLSFVICCIYLVSGGEEEINSHVILDRVKCRIPSLDIRLCRSCSDLRVADECEAEIRII